MLEFQTSYDYEHSEFEPPLYSVFRLNVFLLDVRSGVDSSHDGLGVSVVNVFRRDGRRAKTSLQIFDAKNDALQ